MDFELAHILINGPVCPADSPLNERRFDIGNFFIACRLGNIGRGSWQSAIGIVPFPFARRVGRAFVEFLNSRIHILHKMFNFADGFGIQISKFYQGCCAV